MKSFFIALSCFISASVFSQSIINTLGTSGVFTIKDASSNFFTLTQATGQVNILKTLRLENTTSSTVGVLFKGTDRFMHNYGANNTFLGINSGNFTLTGAINNTGIGRNSLSSLTTGDSNTAIGQNSLFSNTIGFKNVALGTSSLFLNTGGSGNTAVGNGSLSSNTLGNNNTAVGNGSLSSNIDGDANTSVGHASLSTNSTGRENSVLGYHAGFNITTGSNNTLIGFNSNPSSATVNNQITLGDGFVNSLRCNVQSISSLSDVRDKKNIKNLSLGLDFLMKVKPRQFNWDKREWYDGNKSDGSKMKETPTAGFIAQELDQVQTSANAEWLNLVLKDNPEKLEATYGNLLPVMVKAIQELKAENDGIIAESGKLKVESEVLKNENKELKQNNYKLSSEIESLKLMNEKIVKLEKMVNELTSVKYTSLKVNKENATTK